MKKRIYHCYQKNQYPRQPYRKKQHFLPKDIEEMKEQPFTENVGVFTPSLFKVSAGLGMQKARNIFPPKCFSSLYPMNT